MLNIVPSNRFKKDLKLAISVKVYIETPNEKDGFRNATCLLPGHRWADVHGYSDEELERFKDIIRNNAHLIMEFSRKAV